MGTAWVQWSPEPCTQGPGVPWGWWLGEGGVGTPPRFGSQAQPRCLQPPMGLTWSRAGGPPERRSAWCLEPWHRATARSPLRCRRGVLGCRPPLCSELSREAAPAKDLWTVQRQHCSASGKAGRLAIQGPWSPGCGASARQPPPTRLDAACPRLPSHSCFCPHGVCWGGACAWVEWAEWVGWYPPWPGLAACPGLDAGVWADLSWARGSVDAGHDSPSFPG